MAKVLPATCQASVVTCEGQVITGAEILSQGTASSSGILVIDGEKSYYVASSEPDLEDLIDALGEIIQQIETIATGLDAVTVSPGSNAASITVLTTLRTQFETMKDNLI